MRFAFLPSSPAATPATPVARRHPVHARVWGVTLAVTAGHGLALWALQQAWERPVSPQVTPPRVVKVSLAPAAVTAPAPVPEPAPITPPSRREPVPRQWPKPVPRSWTAPEATPPAPAPVATPAPAEAATETSVPIAASTPVSTAAAATQGGPSIATEAAAAAPAAPPAPPRIELPSASAAYLNNPPPAYPALSRRLGEQGRVVLRVRIEPDGTASAAEIRTSSGYERLDEAARQAVLSWRYVPGKRNGVPEAMWFLIPIQFELR